MPNRPKVPCSICKKPLYSGSTSLPSGQRTCQPCRKVQVHAARCIVCSSTFAKGKPSVAKRTCSPGCAVVARRQTLQAKPGRLSVERKCEVCSKSFRRTYGAQRTCGRACGVTLRQKVTRSMAVAVPRVVRTSPTCVVCARVFVGNGRRKYCSLRCQLDRNVAKANARVTDLYRMASAAGHSGKHWRRLLVGYLRERDGDKCKICRRVIRFDLRSGPRGHDSGPSVDHVVPRSQGGSDELANLRLAHWGCNRQRNNRGGNEQLLLFG